MSFGNYLTEVIPNIALVLLGGIALYAIIFTGASIRQKFAQRKYRKLMQKRGFYEGTR